MRHAACQLRIKRASLISIREQIADAPEMRAYATRIKLRHYAIDAIDMIFMIFIAEST